MQSLNAVSISDLKKDPLRFISEAEGEPVIIVSNNKIKAYLISTDTYEKMLDVVDDLCLQKIVEKRLLDAEGSIKVSLNRL